MNAPVPLMMSDIGQNAYGGARPVTSSCPLTAEQRGVFLSYAFLAVCGCLFIHSKCHTLLNNIML